MVAAAPCVVLRPGKGGASEGQMCICRANTVKVPDKEGSGTRRAGTSITRTLKQS